MHFSTILVLPALIRFVAAASRSTPPSGSLTVGSSGIYSSISAAVAAASAGDSIFIYAGTYSESVLITDNDITIYGQTTDTSTYASNTVTITHSASQLTTGSNDDSTGTLRVHGNNFKLYNVDVVNSYGKGSQALALSATGTEQGYYASSFVSYQDTVYTDTGSQYFGKSYIEGAVDFIFGQTGNAYFKDSTIASVGVGCITASGPPSSTEGIMVFDSCTVEVAADATSSLTGEIYLGRPWTEYARSVFKDSSLSSIINAAGWSEWSAATPNTEYVLFAEYNNTGSGSATSGRASFSKQLTSSSVASYSIANILGSGYASWVDADYL